MRTTSLYLRIREDGTVELDVAWCVAPQAKRFGFGWGLDGRL